MFETMASFMLVEHANGAMFDPPLGPAVYPRTVAPNRRPYRTRDGYIAALIYNDKHWNAFIDAVRPAWATELYDSRTARERHRHRLRTGRPNDVGAHDRRVDGIVPRAGDPRRADQHTRRAVRPSHLNAVGCSKRWTEYGPVRMPGVPTWFSKTPGRIAGPTASGRGHRRGARRAWARLGRHRARGGLGWGAAWTSRWGQRPPTCDANCVIW